MALAYGGARVLLVDADMRRPGLHRPLRLTNERGLSQVLTGQARVRDVIQRTVDPNLLAITAGELQIPDGYGVIEGEPTGNRRAVGIVVARFNGELTGELLRRALDELERLGVGREAVTVIPVPGAFELPLAAMALAKTRRYSCIVALGAVIRGETPHFEYVASEAASGLQLAGLETGVPVAFGVLTTEDEEQARARLDKGAEAVRTALEMADVFSQLRAAAGAASP